MNAEQIYLFDLQGYVVLKGVVPPQLVAEVNEVLDRFEEVAPADYPPPLALGPEHSDNSLFISNILEGDPALRPLIDLPPVIDVISTVTGGPYRLNHTYAIYRWGGGYTGLHMHGTPIQPKCHYRCHNGQMLSTLTKAVFPMVDARAEDGCFAVTPGAHKSNFPRPFGNEPADNPALVAVEADAGDCIIFTEALTHGSMTNTSRRPRRTVYYCYSTGYMPDWGEHHLTFSGAVNDGLTEAQQEIIKLKM